MPCRVPNRHAGLHYGALHYMYMYRPTYMWWIAKLIDTDSPTPKIAYVCASKLQGTTTGQHVWLVQSWSKIIRLRHPQQTIRRVHVHDTATYEYTACCTASWRIQYDLYCIWGQNSSVSTAWNNNLSRLVCDKSIWMALMLSRRAT